MHALAEDIDGSTGLVPLALLSTIVDQNWRVDNKNRSGVSWWSFPCTHARSVLLLRGRCQVMEAGLGSGGGGGRRGGRDWTAVIGGGGGVHVFG